MRTFSFPNIWSTLSWILNKNIFSHRKGFNIYFLIVKLMGALKFCPKIWKLVQRRKVLCVPSSPKIKVQIQYLNDINIFRDKIQVLYLPLLLLLLLLLSALIWKAQERKNSLFTQARCESDNSSIETIRLLLDL